MGTFAALNGNELLYVNPTVGSQSQGTPTAALELTTTQAVATTLLNKRGTFTLTGATPLAVTYAGAGANQLIVISLNTVGGTQGLQPVVTQSGSGSFTVVGTALDTSVYNWAAF